jgi:hypothetical protein
MGASCGLSEGLNISIAMDTFDQSLTGDSVLRSDLFDLDHQECGMGEGESPVEMVLGSKHDVIFDTLERRNTHTARNGRLDIQRR